MKNFKENTKSLIKNTIKNSFLDDILIDSFQSEYEKYAPSKLSVKNSPNPYSSTKPPSTIDNNKNIIFITSRFRTGSTLLWNLFRQTKQFKAFYEPFNERQWFNKAKRGVNTDTTHKHVTDYWKEYNNLEKLGQYYDESWIRDQLYMDQHSFNPNMKNYIDTIINSCSEDIVLQFNRIDFRLPWIKHHFPNAKILHLYRNPRDQWISTLVDKNKQSAEAIDAKIFHDYFYLNLWAKDLAMAFPILKNWKKMHSYELFYMIWKLSYLYGDKYSDLSISYENLAHNPKNTTDEISAFINIKEALSTELIELKASSHWTDYAQNEWFHEKEQQCEELLNHFLN